MFFYTPALKKYPSPNCTMVPHTLPHLSLSLSLPLTHTVSHSHTSSSHTLSLTLTHANYLTHTLSLILPHTYYLSLNIHPISHSRTIPHSHTRMLLLSLSLTHTNIHTPSPSQTRTLSLPNQSLFLPILLFRRPEQFQFQSDAIFANCKKLV